MNDDDYIRLEPVFEDSDHEITWKFWIDERDGLWEVTTQGGLPDVFDKATRTLPVPANFVGWWSNMGAAHAELQPVHHPCPGLVLDVWDFDERRQIFREVSEGATSAAAELLPANWRLLTPDTPPDAPGEIFGVAESIWIDKPTKLIWISETSGGGISWQPWRYRRISIDDDALVAYTSHGLVVAVPAIHESSEMGLRYLPNRPAPKKS